MQSLRLMWWILPTSSMTGRTMRDLYSSPPWLCSTWKKVAILALQIPLTMTVWGRILMVPRSKPYVRHEHADNSPLFAPFVCAECHDYWKEVFQECKSIDGFDISTRTTIVDQEKSTDSAGKEVFELRKRFLDHMHIHKNMESCLAAHQAVGISLYDPESGAISDSNAAHRWVSIVAIRAIFSTVPRSHLPPVLFASCSKMSR